MKLLVLAGGFGTRLKTAVSNVPKALAPVGGSPFLQFQIDNWLNQGVRDFTFLLHHQADKIVYFLNEYKTLMLKDCNVEWLIEAAPLGTGGAIANAVKELSITEDFLVTNADTWLDRGVFEIKQSCAPSILVTKTKNVARYGQVNLDRQNCVTSFSEKNVRDESGWVSAGLCKLSADLFERWNGHSFSLEDDLFPDLVANQRLKGVSSGVNFIDIGIPKDYRRFCRLISSRRHLS